MEAVNSKRDYRFDVLKGISILIVVLGHTFQYTLPNFGSLLIFNIIWSVQIPLFITISGYFAISRSTTAFLPRMKKILLRYLLPAVSFYLISFFIVNRSDISGFGRVFNKLELTLWYLVVLFFLATANNIVCALVKNREYDSFLGFIKYSVIFFLIIALWLIVYKMGGSTFLGSKFVLYYSVYYWLGIAWKFIKTRMEATKFSIKSSHMNIFYSGCLAIWAVLLLTYNSYSAADTIMGILPRAICSVCGVFSIIYFVMKVCENKEAKNIQWLLWLGTNSLEIYFVHMFIAHNLEFISKNASIPEQAIAVVVNMLLLLIASVFIIHFVKKSRLLKLILFGNLKKE